LPWGVSQRNKSREGGGVRKGHIGGRKKYKSGEEKRNRNKRGVGVGHGAVDIGKKVDSERLGEGGNNAQGLL